MLEENDNQNQETDKLVVRNKFWPVKEAEANKINKMKNETSKIHQHKFWQMEMNK